MKRLSWFFIFFALFWSVLVLLFDSFAIKAIFHQWRSRTFLPVPARILSSEIRTKSDSDGSTYAPQVRYEFHVDGQRYESDRVRFGQMGESNRTPARAIVDANPVGATRTAYYDPANPAEAVLYRGVSGQSVFLVLFLMPFNAAMVYLVGLAWSTNRRSPPAGGAVIRPVAGTLHIWHRKFTPAVAAVATLGGVSFASIFVLAISYGFSPPLHVVTSVLAGIVIFALYNAIWSAKNAHKNADLVIDAGNGTLTIPRVSMQNLEQWRAWKKAGKPPLTLRLEQIRGVEVRERVSHSSDGDSRSYVPVLLVARTESETPVEHDVGSWMLQDRAESFAQWLRETLNLPASR